MALVSSGVEYNQHSEVALSAVPRVHIIMDDDLMEDSDGTKHEQHVREVLGHCRRHKITLSPE